MQYQVQYGRHPPLYCTGTGTVHSTGSTSTGKSAPHYVPRMQQPQNPQPTTKIHNNHNNFHNQDLNYQFLLFPALLFIYPSLPSCYCHQRGKKKTVVYKMTKLLEEHHKSHAFHASVINRCLDGLFDSGELEETMAEETGRRKTAPKKASRHHNSGPYNRSGSMEMSMYLDAEFKQESQPKTTRREGGVLEQLLFTRIESGPLTEEEPILALNKGLPLLTEVKSFRPLPSSSKNKTGISLPALEEKSSHRPSARTKAARSSSNNNNGAVSISAKNLSRSEHSARKSVDASSSTNEYEGRYSSHDKSPKRHERNYETARRAYSNSPKQNHTKSSAASKQAPPLPIIPNPESKSPMSISRKSAAGANLFTRTRGSATKLTTGGVDALLDPEHSLNTPSLHLEGRGHNLLGSSNKKLSSSSHEKTVLRSRIPLRSAPAPRSPRSGKYPKAAAVPSSSPSANPPEHSLDQTRKSKDSTSQERTTRTHSTSKSSTSQSRGTGSRRCSSKNNRTDDTANEDSARPDDKSKGARDVRSTNHSEGEGSRSQSASERKTRIHSTSNSSRSESRGTDSRRCSSKNRTDTANEDSTSRPDSKSRGANDGSTNGSEDKRSRSQSASRKRRTKTHENTKRSRSHSASRKRRTGQQNGSSSRTLESKEEKNPTRSSSQSSTSQRNGSARRGDRMSASSTSSSRRKEETSNCLKQREGNTIHDASSPNPSTTRRSSRNRLSDTRPLSPARASVSGHGHRRDGSSKQTENASS